jgi:hypothetical protein
MVAGPGGGAVLDGVLERVTFANPETWIAVALASSSVMHAARAGHSWQ